MLYLPVVYLKARKFALLFSLGSLLALASLSMLKGPSAFFWHMLSRDRALLSLAYFVSTIAAIYCAVSVRTMIGAAAFAGVEVSWITFIETIQFTLIHHLHACSQEIASLAALSVSYIPGGLTGLRVIFSVCESVPSSRSCPCPFVLLFVLRATLSLQSCQASKAHFNGSCGGGRRWRWQSRSSAR
jgi:hypothetical protein